MIYENYQYKLTPDQQKIDYSVILGLPTFATIPDDMDNRDWETYQKWLAEGNEPLPGGYSYISDGNGGYKDNQILRLPDKTIIIKVETEQWEIYQTWLSFGNIPSNPISI